MDISKLRVDVDKMQKGVWVAFYEDIELCIANINNEAYKKARKEAMQPHLKSLRFNADGDKVIEILKPVIAKHILVDWKGIEENGKKVPYSSKKALEYFNDPGLADLLAFVLETAGERELYKQRLFEDGVKN